MRTSGRVGMAAAVLWLFLFGTLVRAQTTGTAQQGTSSTAHQPGQTGSPSTTNKPPDAATQSKSATQATPPATTPCAPDIEKCEGRQTNRMFWVVPNFAAVSANTTLPRMTVRQKFTTSMHDSVDYTSFIWAGILAGQSMALKSYPELHQGAAGYGRYYWRAFVDQASGAFFTEALVPVVTREDPRYYTMEHGNIFRRTLYALSQVVLTKTDAETQKETFNFSEVLGNGLEAGLANAYYPPEERGLRHTMDNWALGIESAALNNIVKEFWPDIRQKIFKQK